MQSWRLWRTIADADINDPIFRRVSQIQQPTARSMPRWRPPRLLSPAMIVAAIAVVILAPQLLALVLILPMIMITLVVAAPLYLPLVVWLAGAVSTGEIISGIYREKHQHTYDLICASTQGKLQASWSFASGIRYRGGAFAALRWGTVASARVGLASLAGLALFVFLFAIFNHGGFGIEQLRLLLIPLLLIALYGTNMTQTFVMSHIIGLLASSFDWAKRDALLIGLLAYGLLGLLPLAGAGLTVVAFTGLAFEPQPLMRLAVETGAPLLIIAARELTTVALWSALKRRMNARPGEVDGRQVLRRGAAWAVT